MVPSRKVVYKASTGPAKSDKHENQMKVQNFTKMEAVPSSLKILKWSVEKTQTLVSRREVPGNRV